MKTLAPILLVAFITISVLGVFVIGSMNEMDHGKCLATAVNGFICPNESVATRTIFHVNAARALTTTILALSLISLALFVGFKIAGLRIQPLLSRVIRKREEIQALSFYSSFIFWNALQERSPVRM